MTDDYTPEKVAGICEIPEQDLLTAVQWMANTPKMVSTVFAGILSECRGDSRLFFG